MWNDFVQFNVNKGYAGVENLSLIPGTVGACPIQNIGAYGVEVKDTIVEVEACGLDRCGAELEVVAVVGDLITLLTNVEGPA